MWYEAHCSWCSKTKDRQAGCRTSSHTKGKVEGKITHLYKSSLHPEPHQRDDLWSKARYVALEPFFVTCETGTHLLQKEELPCSDRNPQPLSMLRLWMNTGCFKKRSIHLKNNEHLFLSFSGCSIRRWTFVYNRHVSLWYTAGICTHHASGVIQGLATRAAGHHQIWNDLAAFQRFWTPWLLHKPLQLSINLEFSGNLPHTQELEGWSKANGIFVGQLQSCGWFPAGTNLKFLEVSVPNHPKQQISFKKSSIQVVEVFFSYTIYTFFV